MSNLFHNESCEGETAMQLPNITVIHPACVPIATQLCRVAKIRETINHMVQWREANTRISPGLLLETLIICILCDRKPLWKVEQFWCIWQEKSA